MAIYNDRIRELRQLKNLTLKEVADSVGTTEATMQRYESGNGIKSIPYDILFGLHSYMNVPHLILWVGKNTMLPQMLTALMKQLPQH